MSKKMFVGPAVLLAATSALCIPFSHEVQGDVVSATYDMGKDHPGKLASLTIETPHGGREEFNVAALDVKLDPAQKNVTATINTRINSVMWMLDNNGKILDVKFSGPGLTQ